MNLIKKSKTKFKTHRILDPAAIDVMFNIAVLLYTKGIQKLCFKREYFQEYNLLKYFHNFQFYILHY